MDTSFWLSIILIPFIINIISTIMYEFVKPKFITWKAQTSEKVARFQIEEIKNQINEITKYKNDYDLLVRVSLREILRAFWYILIIGMVWSFYLLGQSILTLLTKSEVISYSYSQSILELMPVGFLSFFWIFFNQSLQRVLVYYRLLRDVIDYDDFIKTKTDEIRNLEQMTSSVNQDTEQISD